VIFALTILQLIAGCNYKASLDPIALSFKVDSLSLVIDSLQKQKEEILKGFELAVGSYRECALQKSEHTKSLENCILSLERVYAINQTGHLVNLRSMANHINDWRERLKAFKDEDYFSEFVSQGMVHAPELFR
jgi:hypothetical protein